MLQWAERKSRGALQNRDRSNLRGSRICGAPRARSLPEDTSTLSARSRCTASGTRSSWFRGQPSPSLLDHDLVIELLPLLALIKPLRRIDDIEGDVERLHLHVGRREVAVEQDTLRI